MSDTPASEAAEAATDGLVQPLPDTLASKIAAGEVVQRPANALKELLENALDAGASRVEVTLKRAGSELIQVVDDGCGMGPVDAAASFGRHATSKLREFEDLERLRTLGFRGEALASIASVAQVELKTRRRQDETAWCVRVDGGEVVEEGPCAASEGTCVSVRNLFYNVPARRAFLKSPATEFKHLVETFQSLALSHPTVAFSLVHDGTEVWRLAPTDDAEAALVRRLSDLVGGDVEGDLVPVEETTSYLSIRGVVAQPQRSRRSRGDQYLFVNGRFVKSRSLDHAVAQAFGALLPEKQHPLFALFLGVDPRHVDVNVHPTKTEVKFDDDRGVYSFVRAVVKRALAEGGLGLTFDVGANPVADLSEPTLPAPPALPTASGGDGAPRAPASGPPPGVPIPPRHETVEAFGGGDLDLPDLPAPSVSPRVLAPPPRGPIPSRLGPAPDADHVGDLDLGEADPARTLWQLHGRYLLSPVRSGLLVVDQCAAHARILYERALTTMEGGMAPSQQLLFPFTVDLGPADRALLDEVLPDLRALGFEMAVPEDEGAVTVRGVPIDVTLGDERDVLDDLLSQYRRNAQRFRLGARENLARSMASRSAIRPGHVLGPAEARSLVDQLFACDDPFTDPVGRPTMTRLSTEELERRFRP